MGWIMDCAHILLVAALSPLLIITTNRKMNSRLRCVVQERPVQDSATTLSTV
jgi:hypothetical protein